MRPHPAWPTDVPRPRRRRGATALWQRLLLTAAVAAAVLSAFSARRGQGGLFGLAESGRGDPRPNFAPNSYDSVEQI
jgi:hypothetical protein